MYVDTHTHLYDDQFATDADAIPRALHAGVQKMYLPNCDSTTVVGMLAVADQYPGNCFPMMGLHPCYVKDNYKEELSLVAQQLQQRRYYAIGEIGLDYYWDLTYKQQQLEALGYQIDLAMQYDLPIVLHSRESTQDCIDVVRSKQNGQLRGIFHCFSGTLEEAKQITNMGLYLGIGGVATYKKSNLPDIIKEVALEHLVLETDAPYLAPTPYRGKRNESSYLPIIADKIAAIKGVPIEEVARITTVNAEKIFRN